jgi:cytochrome c biogenesis protein CcdA
MNYSSLICYCLVVLGGIFLICFPLSPDGRTGQPWIRRAFVFAGGFCILWGIAGFCALFFSDLLHAKWITLFSSLRVGFGGAAIGLIIFAFSSKEAWKKKIRKESRTNASSQ